MFATVTARMEFWIGAYFTARFAEKVVAQRAVRRRQMVLGPVPRSIEVNGGAGVFPFPSGDVVKKRDVPYRREVRVGSAIPMRIEVEIGLTAFFPTVGAKVYQRVDVCLMNVRIPLQVPLLID